MGIVDEDIERLRSTVSIVDTIQQYVALKRVGRNWVGLCPFHAERTPSFNVREETGRYKCFGCDKSGDVFTFVQEHEHVDFVGAVEYLAAKVGMQLTYTTTGQTRERARRKQLVEAMGTAIEWYHRTLLDDPSARAARASGSFRRRWWYHSTAASIVSTSCLRRARSFDCPVVV
jgi:DNA primase